MKLQTVAQVGAVGFGTLFGLIRFWQGLQAIFTVTPKEGWLAIISVLIATWTLLPLSLIGIARPKWAAHGLLLTACASAVIVWYWGFFLNYFSATSDRIEFSATILLPLIVTGLLFYSVGSLAKRPLELRGRVAHLLPGCPTHRGVR